MFRRFYGTALALIDDWWPTGPPARMRFDRCATVEHQFAAMREAGFHDVDCSFKAWRFAVLSGRA